VPHGYSGRWGQAFAASAEQSGKRRRFARNSPWLWLGRNGVERALLVGPMFIILVVELANSAIEATVDRIGYEHHELSGLAKDLGSAAVFCAFLLLGVTWLLVLWK